MEFENRQQSQLNGWKSWGLALLLGLSISLGGCKGDVSALDAALGKIGVDTGSGAGNDTPTIPAYSLTVLSGNLQTAATLAPFANPLRVQVLQQGQPMMGASVFFTITSGVSATLSQSLVVTDALGVASVDLTAGSTPGSLTVRAQTNGLSADFFETVQSPGYVLSALAGAGQTTNVSSTFNSPLTVQLLYNGAPAVGQSVNFGVLSGASLTLSSYSSVTDASGVASITVAAGSQLGPAVIRAAYMNRTVDFNLTVQASGYTLAAIAGNNQSGAPGTTFGTPLRVLLLNNGVPAANANVSYMVQSGGGGSFSAVTATTDTAGMAQTSFTAGGTAGPTTIRATFGAQSVDFSLNIVDQSGTVIAKISGDSQQANIGTTVSLPLKVQVTSASSGLAASGILVRFQVTSGNGQLNTTNNTATVSTDANGYAQANFDVGTVGTTNSITAGIVSVPLQVVAFNATGVIPPNSNPDLSQSRVTVANASINADGSSTTLVTLTAKDVYGNQIPAGGKTVVFSTNAGSLVTGTLTDLGDGRYTQYYRAPSTTVTNPATVTATINGAAITSAPASINLLAGNISLTQSSISTSNASITADGSSTTLVTVTLRDALGNQVTAPGSQAVVIQASGGSLIGSVNSVGDGTYTQTYRAPTLSGSVTLTASVGGAPLANPGMLMLLAGAPVASNTLITATPSVILPNGISTTIVSVQPRDVYQNTLTYGGHTITLTKNNGTWLSGAGNTVTAGDNGDGTYSATLKSVITPGVARVTGTLNGSAFPGSATVYFSDGTSGPSASKSTVTLGAAVVPADGVTTTAVTVTLRDNSNNQISNGGSNVTIAATAGTLVGSVTDNQNGTYTQLLRAPASAANQVEVTASVDGATIVNKALIDFYGSISLAQSTLIASPSLVLADGTSTSTVILTAKDANGVSIPVGGVTGLSLASTAGTWSGTLSDNSNGTYTRTLVAPSSAALATVSATLSGNAFSSSATVQFFANNALANGTVIHCGNISTYKNTNVYMNGGTLTMDTRGPNGYCPNDFVFNSVILRGGATLTHTATTSTQEYGLEFSTPYLEIDATSSINVDSKGYLGSTSYRFRVQGNQEVQNASANDNGYGGGSHGGRGAVRSGHDTNKTYGSIFQPTTLGASGGVTPGYIAYAGGGRIKITITGSGTLLNNGRITAGGGCGSGFYGGNCGAGGSVWINTTILSGSGLVAADGGSSTTTAVAGNFQADYPGGGGRVAVYYTTGSGNFAASSIVNNITAFGGNTTVTGSQQYADTRHGAAGTIYLKPSSLTYGNLILNNGGRVNGATAARTLINAPAVAVPDALSSTTLTKASAYGDSYSTSNPFVGWYIDPNTTQNASATLTDNLLFAVSSGDQNTVTSSGGGMSAVGNGSQMAELVLKFDNVDIIGGALLQTTAKILVLNGDYSSQSTTGVAINGVPSTAIEYANAGSVSMTLNGQTVSQLPNVFAPTGDLTITGGTGTLSLTRSLTVGGFVSFNGLTVNGQGYSITGKNFSATNSTINLDGIATTLGNVTFNNSTVTLGKSKGSYSIDTPATLDLQNGSVLSQRATTATAEYSLEISAGNVTVAAGTKISANARGYAPPGSAGYRSFGNNLVNAFNGNASTLRAGGSHGGRGGSQDSGNFPPEVYGSILAPASSGASGSYTGCTAGGCTSGGGIVRIITPSSGTVQIDGTIDTNGGDTAYGYCGLYATGAGGSVYVNAGTVTGTGLITANGGSKLHSACNGDFGGGGGGRIAVLATTLGGKFTWPPPSPASTWGVQAYGGFYATGQYSQNGAAGTIYFKTPADPYGRLAVINDSRFTAPSTAWSSENFTVINMPTSAANTAISATSLSAVSGTFTEAGATTGHLAGFYVNPNTAQNATATFADDTLFRIVSHTGSDLTTSASGADFLGGNTATNLTSKAAPTQSFRVQLLLDEVQVLSPAILKTSGIIYAKAGTLNTTVLQTTGSAGSLAFAGTNSVTLGGIAPVSDVNMTGSGAFNLSSGANIDATGATLSAPAMTFTGATAAADRMVSTTGDITLDASTVTLGRLKGNNSLSAAGSLVLQNTSTLLQRATTISAEYSLEMTAANVTVGSGSKILAAGRGFLPPSSTFLPNTAGWRTFGNVVNNKAFNANTTAHRAGGSHGGRGGSNDTTNYPPEVYGNVQDPYTSGSSGSNTGCLNGGCSAGGGIIRIDSGSGTIRVDGSIDASGGDTAYGYCGSYSLGAGGSIKLNAGTITGAGTVFSNGGSKAHSACNGEFGGGGGGRVAVQASTLAGNFAWAPTSSWGFRSYGGYYANGQNTQNGGAGTIYVKLTGDTDGRLVVLNDSRFTAPATTWANEPFTVLNVPAPSLSSSLAATSLTHATPGYFDEGVGTTGWLAGYYVNPNTSQNATATLADDSLFKITSSTGTALTTASSLTSVATSGNTFRIHPVYDQVWLGANTVFKTNAAIISRGGSYSGALLAADSSSGLAFLGSNSVTLGASGAQLPIVDMNLTGSATLNITAGANIGATGYTLSAPSMSITGATVAADALVTTSGNLLVDSSNVTLGRLRTASPGGSNYAINAAGSLTLQNSSTLFQRATTTTAEYTLEVNAANITVGAGSSISAQLRGFTSPNTQGYRGFGNTILGAWNGSTGNIGGGSHGGRGGVYGTGHRPADVYGNIQNPYSSGSSGSYAACIDSGGCTNGGGIIRLITPGAGTVQIDGTVDASGGAHSLNQRSGLGAGGTVYVSTGTLAGSGQVTVNGGTSGGWYGADGGAGGGGRIAVYASTLSGNYAWPPTSSWGLRAYGGFYTTSTNDTRNGAAGTIFVKLPADTDGRLVVMQDTRITGGTTNANETFTMLNVPAPATSSAMTGTTLSTATPGYFDEGAGTTGWLNGYYLNPNTAQNATSTISDDTLYKITGATSTVLTTAGTLTSSGASGNTFRIHPTFDQLWTGTTAIVKTNAIIKVLGGTIAGNILGTGSLSLVGTSGTTTLSGVAPIFESLITGTGTLAFGTGANVNAATVALTAPSITISGATLNVSTITATAGDASFTGSTITANQVSAASGNISLTNTTATIPRVTATSGNITLDSSTVTSGLLKGNTAISAAGDLILQNSATLQQLATTTTAEYSLEIAAANVTVNSGSKISASAKGYTSPSAAGHRGFNNTLVPAWNTSGSQNAAGSHGGRGGGWGTANEVYGSFANPYTSGASASFGMYNSNGGTAGGGIIRITLGGSGTIQVDGTIENNGGDLNSCVGGQGGTGAGGSIYLSGGTLAGSGTVFANGGTASCNVAGGGGGRVAAYFTTLSGNYAWPPTSTWGLRAYGGYRTTGQDQNNGGAGTVFVKLPSDTYGRMALINDSRMVMNNTYAVEPYTILNVPTVAASTGLTANTLTAAGGTFSETAGTTGHLEGYAVNPNTAQNATAALSDDTLFRITSHTGNVLTTASGLTTVGVSGNNFRLHPVFDQLFLTNSVVKTNAAIFTRALTLFNGQQIGTGSVAVNSTSNITATGTTNLVTLFSELVSTGAISLTGGTFNFSDATSTAATFTNATLTSSGAITTTSGAVTLDNSTLTIGKLRSAGSDGGPDGSAIAINSAGALTLQNNALLQQTLTTVTAEYSLEIQASGLNLAAGSRISATGRGYYNGDYTSYQGYFRSFGNVNVGGWGGATGYRYAGGSHGGRGGSNDSGGSQRSNETYGSIFNPYTSGSAGGSGNDWWQTQAGGGIVRINVGTGDLIVNGKIEAEGWSGGGNVCLGAGGSIYLKGGTLQGSGSVTANGGTWTSGGDPRGGGGGGRVAVYAPSLQGNFAWSSTGFQTYVTATGGIGNNIGKQAGAGTVYVKTGSDVYGRLVIKNGTNSLDSTYSNQPFTRIDVPSVTTSDSVAATSLTKAAYFTEGVGFTGHLMGFWVNANTGQNATSTVFDDVLAPVLSHSASVLTTPSGLTSSPISAVAGNNFRMHPVFDQLKILGNAIVMTNATVITTDFEQVGSVTGTGGIALNSASNSLSLSGSTVRGAFAELSLGTGLDLSILSGASATFPNTGISIGRDLNISTGTVTLPTLNVNVGRDFNISSGATVNATRVTVGGNLNLTGSSTTLSAGLDSPATTANTIPNVVVAGNLSVGAGSKITSPGATATNEYYLYMTAANFDLAASGLVDVNGKGYINGEPPLRNYFRSLGNANFLGQSGSSVDNIGGSYGGEGSSTSNSVYGSFRSPIYLGTGASDVNGGWYGGTGGGAVRIETTGNMTINGTISANANSALETAGSGGSVYLNAGGTLSGSGSITAHGGNATNGNRGPGGGGRIAIYYGTGSGGFASNALIAAAAKAYGGIDTTTAAKSAAAGTVFFKSASEVYGNLSIDNGNRVTTNTGARTVILSTSGTNLSSVSSTSIAVGGAFSNQYSYNNFLEGLFINPRTTQNATSGLSDDTIFRISSNSASTLNLTAGDATTIAAANDPYRMVLRLDNLDVVGKATLSFPNHDIYVSDGDITSGNANFLLDGTVYARTLDIGTGTYSMSANGVQSNLTNRCAGAVNTANGASLSCP